MQRAVYGYGVAISNQGAELLLLLMMYLLLMLLLMRLPHAPENDPQKR